MHCDVPSAHSLGGTSLQMLIAQLQSAWPPDSFQLYRGCKCVLPKLAASTDTFNVPYVLAVITEKHHFLTLV